jgi:hypothetical protein
MTPSPPRSGPFDPTRLLAPLTGLLVCVVLAGILRTYPRYVPPDFTTDFLLGRQPCAAASATPQRPHRAGLSEGESLT